MESEPRKDGQDAPEGSEGKEGTLKGFLKAAKESVELAVFPSPSKPLVVWFKREWRGVRAGRVLFSMLATGLVALSIWYTHRLDTKYKQNEIWYPGQTYLKLRFRGSNQVPESIAQENVFRWYSAPTRITALTQTGESVGTNMFWWIFLVFDRSVDPTAWNFGVQSDTFPQPACEVRDFYSRSAIVIVHGDVPPTVLDLRLQKPPGK